MDRLFQKVADATGSSSDQIKLVACLLVSYPLGSIFVRIPRSQPSFRHLFSIIITGFYLLPVLNLWGGALQLLCSTLATYILAAVIHGRNMPWVVFAVVMGHLTLNHAYRTIYKIPLEVFEITAPQMVLTMKLTTFAWNVWDGRRPVEDLDKWQLKHRVVKMPSLLEFLGYAFYFPGFLVGPYTEYSTYASLIDGSVYESAEGQVSNGSKKFKYVPHGRKRVAYTRMLSGFISLGLYVLLGTTYQYQTILTDSWLLKGPFTRIMTVQLLGMVARTKYYAVWLLSEGACILTGLGFTGYTVTGSSRWDGAANVNIPLIEWPPNFKVLLDSWNMKTNTWLRESIYKRLARKGKKPGFKSTMATFLTSAFWHGFAGGYYLTFILGGFISAAARQCRTYLRPLLSPPLQTPPTLLKRSYDFTGHLASMCILNFAVAPFMICDFYDSLETWRRMYWYGLWLTGGTLMFFTLGGKSWATSMAQKRVKRAEQRLVEETKGVKVVTSTNDTTPESYVVAPIDLAISTVEK
ncbi:MBOAT, membrane-bound O-acyltransferase family-domain-containing protein [Hysterangium stoloniferum]|nr:MBOAT, membrane-bound O-acyltransferase family-domain-containing protein [Hysterangium stoloniferum]